jgi:hypothetical protein
MGEASLSKHPNVLLGIVFLVCLLPLLPSVAEGQSLSLTGTWYYNSFVTGPGAPWWEKGTLTVTPTGTFSGSGLQSNGKPDNPAGSFTLTSSGVLLMNLNGQSKSALCQLDTSSTFLSCSQTLSNGSSSIMIMTQQAPAYSLADLAGTWEGNLLFAGPTPLWERVGETINSDGTFTGTYTRSDGTTGSVSGTLAISSSGVITCVSGGCTDPTYASVMDLNKTVTVGTDGASTSTQDAGLLIYTKQPTSYTISNLVGTWYGLGLASGPGAPWWESDILAIKQDGTCSFNWIASNGTSGSKSGTLSISSAGVMTLNIGSTAMGVIDANMTVMVFTNTWTDGATQEIRIFTNNVLTGSNVSPILAPSPGYVPGTTPYSPTMGGSTGTAPYSGAPAPTSTALQNPAGGTGAQAAGSAAGSGQTGGNTPASSANAETSSAPSGPSASATPASAPDAPTIIAATTGFGPPTEDNAKALVSFKLPSTSGGQITGCTVTSNPGSITATGIGSPITVANLNGGTTYTFTVTASNKSGTGPPSDVSNSVTPIAVPGAPTIMKAKAGNGEATVSFKPSASDGGSGITSYIVKSSAGQTVSGPTGPVTVKGLANGTSYTFTVAAVNKIGTGPPSKVSDSVTPATVPDAPAIIAAKAGNGKATVSFKVPASNGGSRITSYTVTSNAGHKASGPAGPITVKGLANGTPYTFTITAKNKMGTGPPSSASNSVTPRRLKE